MKRNRIDHDGYDAVRERGEVARGSDRTDIVPDENDVRTRGRDALNTILEAV